jgi:hypothetical protein
METHNAARRPRHIRWLAASALCALLLPALGLEAAEPAASLELKAPAKPMGMPAFVLPTTAGTQLDSRSLEGQVVIVRFWASW